MAQDFVQSKGLDADSTYFWFDAMVKNQHCSCNFTPDQLKQVFGPAAMTDSFVFGSRRLPAGFAQAPAHVRAYYMGAGFGDGGVIATASDVARFYRALFLDQTLPVFHLLAQQLTYRLEVVSHLQGSAQVMSGQVMVSQNKEIQLLSY